RCANHGDGGNADACGVLPVATGRPALTAAEGPIVTTLKSAGLAPTAGFPLGLSAVAVAGCGRAIGFGGLGLPPVGPRGPVGGGGPEIEPGHRPGGGGQPG